ncbi:MAG: NTP transferase domain-containing protein [Clostridia bacterium]|nr:NTP transferase domain-containing protein [Clostridia bacterium]
MKAIIMAGGCGTRLRPMTCCVPKPMAKVMNKPVMEHIIELLKKHGITEIGVTLQYMPDVIKEYFGDGAGFGVKLEYFVEDEPLGTAGSVLAAGDFLDGDFLVISGDALCDIDLSEAIAFHKNSNAEATLVLYTVEVPLEYGVVVTKNDGKITRFLEKPVWSQVFSDTINTGIYVLSPSVFKGFDRKNFDFSKDVFPKLLSEGRALYGYNTGGYWCDIGDIDVYRHCHYDIFDKKADLRIDARQRENGIYICDGAIIEKGAVIKSPAFIGKSSRIKTGAVIEPYTVIGENVTVNSGASVKRSVVWDNVLIGTGAQIRGAVLCDRCIVRAKAAVYEQSLIGEGSIVGEGACVKPGVKVWPYKSIESGESVYTNLVWSRSGQSSLFGEKGISGEVGVDFSAEVVARFGEAYAAMKNGGKIGISSDGSPAGVMMKNAVCSGLCSAGAEVCDFGDQPVPITRAGVKFYGLDGAVHTACNKKGYIEFINEYGADISRDDERKMRALLDRNDFKKNPADEIKKISDIYEYKLYYLRELINSVSNKNLNINILIAVQSIWGQKLLKGAAADLNSNIKIINEPIEDNISDFAKKVANENYDFGAVIDDGCENIVLITDKGKIIDSDLYKVLAALIIMKEYKGAKIVADISAPSVISGLAEKYGATVQITRESPIELMGELCGQNTLPELRDQFVLHFDAVGAIVKLMEFLKNHSLKLSQLLEEIPEFYIIRREVKCSARDKGRVIKSFAETRSDDLNTVDGVQFKDGRSLVLIMPDMKRPVCKMIIESSKEEYAQEAAEIYREKINGIIDGE